MEQIGTYFFDTYAFYELIEGNPDYEPYSEGINIITTKLNLMELHYGILKNKGKSEADKYYDEFLQFVLDIDDDIIKEANEFRLVMKKRDLSYVDCIGYIMAKNNAAKFLTGDKEFEDLDNVEFVK